MKAAELKSQTRCCFLNLIPVFALRNVLFSIPACNCFCSPPISIPSLRRKQRVIYALDHVLGRQTTQLSKGEGAIPVVTHRHLTSHPIHSAASQTPL